MDIRKEASKLTWVKHLERHFSPMIISLICNSTRPENFARIGAADNQVKGLLFQENTVYKCPEFILEAVKKTESELDKKDIFYYSKGLDVFYLESKKILEKSNSLQDVERILTIAFSYVWITHIFEDVYDLKIKSETPKYINGDVEEFILQVSKPIKKNAHSLMEDAIRNGESTKKIIEKYGWIKARHNFTEPFTVDDIEDMKSNLKSHENEKRIEVPKPIKPLIEALQELVYFRTARTDVLYELLFLSRPIFKHAAKKLGIKYEDIESYTIQSLIEGKPKKFGKDVSYCYLKGNLLITTGKIVDLKSNEESRIVKGMVAFSGKVTGIARIVKNNSEISKVKHGEILVTQMTFPSFISAMHKAAAFVTDEGGITCHAAIVSREMKKPCIIGTKNATSILKDGDLVEVDANKGIVRKIIEK